MNGAAGWNVEVGAGGSLTAGGGCGLSCHSGHGRVDWERVVVERAPVQVVVMMVSVVVTA